jgi:outer membrane lipoprotein carrier protein
MRFFYKALGTIFLLVAFGNMAEASALSELSQKLNSLKSARADFVQTIVDGKGRIIQQTSGEMSLQRPGKFRWEVKRPTPQLLIANGQQIWFYDIDLRQIVIQKQQTIGENSPAALLSASTSCLTRQYTVKRLANTTNKQAFQLIPKDKNALFRSISLVFQGNQLQDMSLFDKLEQRTDILFSNFEKNPTLNSLNFHFVFPKDKNVEIIKG